MHKQLSNFAEIREVSVDASTNRTHGVDTANFDGVLFILKTDGTETVKAQQDDELDSSGELLENASDLENGGFQTAANDITFIDIYRPDERYVGLDVADNTAVQGPVLALRYHSRNRPVDNDVEDEIKGLQLISPDEA